MNKTLFALSIAGVTILTVYLLKEEKQEYVEMEMNEDGETVPVEKEKTVRKIDTVKEKVVNKIKEKGIDVKVSKAVVKVVSFMVKYKSEIEGVTAGLGLVAAIFKAKKVLAESMAPTKVYSNEVSYSNLFDEVKASSEETVILDDTNRGNAWFLSYKEVAA